MKKQILISLVILTGFVLALQISHSIDLDKIEKDKLEDLGITNPIISPCLATDEWSCKATIYEKDGINKEIEIETKYCDKYEIIYSNGSCLNYSYTEEQNCINWSNETCIENETIQIQGNCTNWEIVETQGNCSIWKVLNQEEIETQLINQTKILLNQIAEIQLSRTITNEIKTDEIVVEIKEKVKELKS